MAGAAVTPIAVSAPHAEGAAVLLRKIRDAGCRTRIGNPRIMVFHFSSANNPHFMQVRALGAAIGTLKDRLCWVSPKKELQLHTGPFFADITSRRKCFPLVLTAVKKDRGERFAALNCAFSDKAALRRSGDRKRGFITCR